MRNNRFDYFTILSTDLIFQLEVISWPVSKKCHYFEYFLDCFAESVSTCIFHLMLWTKTCFFFQFKTFTSQRVYLLKLWSMFIRLYERCYWIFNIQRITPHSLLVHGFVDNFPHSVFCSCRAFYINHKTINPVR